jgi:uncharacterized protein (DUF2384 family)
MSLQTLMCRRTVRGDQRQAPRDARTSLLDLLGRAFDLELHAAYMRFRQNIRHVKVMPRGATQGIVGQDTIETIKTYIVLINTLCYPGLVRENHSWRSSMPAALKPENPPPVQQDRGALAKMVMSLLDHWKLSTEEQAALLGIAASNRAALTRYRKGEPIGTSRDQYERVGHLLGIHKNLRLLFPQNRDLAYRWMSTRNRAFDNRAPVEVVNEWGFAGLLMVRAYLERARGV